MYPICMYAILLLPTSYSITSGLYRNRSGGTETEILIIHLRSKMNKPQSSRFFSHRHKFGQFHLYYSSGVKKQQE